MRKMLLLLALLASGFFMLGAGASTASAGSCTVDGYPWGQPYLQSGNMNFGERLSCSGYIDKVQFGAGYTKDFYGYYYASAGSPILNTVAYGGGYSAQSFGYTQVPSFCTNTSSHIRNIAAAFSYRIHQVSTNSWGSWRSFTGPYYGDTAC